MVKREVWLLEEEFAGSGMREGEILGEWVLEKKDIDIHSIAEKIINELILADKHLKKENFFVTPMHILVSENGVSLIKEELSCSESEKEKLFYVFY